MAAAANGAVAIHHFHSHDGASNRCHSGFHCGIRHCDASRRMARRDCRSDCQVACRCKACRRHRRAVCMHWCRSGKCRHIAQAHQEGHARQRLLWKIPKAQLEAMIHQLLQEAKKLQCSFGLCSHWHCVDVAWNCSGYLSALDQLLQEARTLQCSFGPCSHWHCVDLAWNCSGYLPALDLRQGTAWMARWLATHQRLRGDVVREHFAEGQHAAQSLP